MAEEQDGNHMSERQEIQQYMQQFCLEDCLDEIMNEVVLQRPQNPYLMISTMFEAKTMPEFLNVEFKSVIVGGKMAVKAVLITNITSFSAVCSYSKPDGDAAAGSSEAEVAMRDYSTLQEKIRDAIMDLSPADVQKFDEAIAALPGVDAAESMALSVACCRAAARHTAQPLHRFVAQLSGTRQEEVSIPVPVVSVLSRVIGGSDAVTQDFTVTPVRAATIGSALQKVMTAANAIAQHEEVLYPPVLSAWGSPCTMGANAEASGKLVKGVLEQLGLASELKQGIQFRAGSMLKQPLDPAATAYTYLLDGPSGAPRSGADVAEMTASLWQELQFISAEDVFCEQDYNSYQLLNKRIQEVIYDAKSNGSGSGSGMLYNAGGVGGDASCSMQVLIDPTTFAGLTDTEHFRQTMPHNCVKVPLSQFSSVSAAVAVVKKAKESKWPIAVCSSDSAALRETDDSFIADFAVGVGAGQLMSGGVFAAESYAKFNRLLEIQGEDNKVPYAGSKFRVSMALH